MKNGRILLTNFCGLFEIFNLIVCSERARLNTIMSFDQSKKFLTKFLIRGLHTILCNGGETVNSENCCFGLALRPNKDLLFNRAFLSTKTQYFAFCYRVVCFLSALKNFFDYFTSY